MSYGLRGRHGRLHGFGLGGVVNPPPPFNNCQPLGTVLGEDGFLLSGSTPIPTQCMSYDTYAANTQGAVAALQSLSNFGVSAIRIYDPAGQKPEIQIMPGEDIVSALKAAGMPLQTPDQGFSYEYSRLFNQATAGTGGQFDPTQVRAKVAAQMLANGWSQQALNDYYAGTPYETGTADALTPYNDPAIAGINAGSTPSGPYSAFVGSPQIQPYVPAQSQSQDTDTGQTSYSPAQLLMMQSPGNPAPAATAQTPSTPSTYYTAPALASSVPAAGTQAAVSATPAVSNTLLIGGLAAVGILIMMSTGRKS